MKPRQLAALLRSVLLTTMAGCGGGNNNSSCPRATPPMHLRDPLGYEDWNAVTGQSIRATTMNLRHTAALALVGWYLMVPPASDWKRFQATEEVSSYFAHLRPFYPAPFEKWKKLGEFYSQVNCESTREFIVRHDGKVESRPMPSNASLASIPNAKQYQANQATCIASDDPRLKVKQK
ncbi:MAG: hypothetical protein ABSD30_16580 [Candidatus Binatus sp.]